MCSSESSRTHSHSHAHEADDITSQKLTHRFKQPNPLKTPDPSTRLSRLLMFLEAQFGAEAVSPIPLPRNSTTNADANNTSSTPTTSTSPHPTNAHTNGTVPSNPYSVASLPPDSPTSSSDNNSPSPADLNISAEDKAELKRLHSIGIPVPGILVKFGKYEAKVWLEDLDVECTSGPLKARVKAVVERGVETVSGLWA